MGFYNVVKPCVVGLLHYVRPTAAPIEVDDEVAAPLVEAGDLSPYRAAAGGVYDVPGSTGDAVAVVGKELYDLGEQWDKTADAITESAEAPAKAVEKPRGRRRSTEG